MTHYYCGRGIRSNIFFYCPLCLSIMLTMRLQMEESRQSLWTGWSKLNHIIPVRSCFSVYNVFFLLLWGNIFNLTFMLPSVTSVCVWKCLHMSDSRNYFSINDIELYRMHVHGSWILQYLQLQVLQNLHYSILWEVTCTPAPFVFCDKPLNCFRRY